MSDETTDTAEQATPEEAGKEKETFSLEYVQQLRSEAARYRNDKKAAVEEAKSALAAEFQVKLDAAGSKYAELEARLAATDLEVAKYRAMVDAEVPTDAMADMVALLSGHDAESIAESVAKAKALMGRSVKDRPVDLTQGSGNTTPLNGDPLLDTVKRLVGA